MTSPLKVGSVSLGRCGLVTVEMASNESDTIGRTVSVVFTGRLTDSILALYSIILVAIASDSWTSLSISPNSQHFIISLSKSANTLAFDSSCQYITSNL